MKGRVQWNPVYRGKIPAQRVSNGTPFMVERFLLSAGTRSEVIKRFSCSTELSMKF